MQFNNMQNESAVLPIVIRDETGVVVSSSRKQFPQLELHTSQNNSTGQPVSSGIESVLADLRYLALDPENTNLRNRILHRIVSAGSNALNSILAGDQRGEVSRDGLAEILPFFPLARDAIGVGEVNLFLRHFLHSSEPNLRLSAAYAFLECNDPSAISDLRAVRDAEASPVLRLQFTKVVRLLGG